MLFVGTKAAVSHFLRQSASPRLTLEALTVLRESMRERVRTPHDLQAAVAQAMQREHQLVTALKEWLDLH